MDSMLLRVSTEIYHRWRQNGVWTSVTHSSAPCEPPFVFTFDVICDLLLNITYDNMESISVNWKSDFSVTQKLDSNLPSFAALTFGVIVIGGAFVVKYVGTMVLQVCFCITVSSIADFFLIAGTMQGSLFDNCDHCLLLADSQIFRSVAEVSDLAICSLTQHRSRVSCENLYVNFNLCSTVLAISI